MSRHDPEPETELAPAARESQTEPEPATMGPELEPADQDPALDVAPRGDRRRGIRFNILTGTLALSAIALLVGYLVVNLVLMPSLTRQGAEVRVPEVIGLSEREAERLLAGEDLRLSKISEQWSPDVPRGFITTQDPPAGGVVKRGRRISVIVSLGAQGTSVPVIPEAAGGLELVGARYCGLLDRRVAHLYYSNGDHHLSLFLVPGPVRDLSRELRPRGNFVRLLRVGGTTVGLVSEEEDSVEAFKRALSFSLAWDLEEVDRSAP